MAHDKAFPRRPDGAPEFHNNHAFHIENKKLVALAGKVSRAIGVEVIDATVTARARHRTASPRSSRETGERMTADLFVDASGFR